MQTVILGKSGLRVSRMCFGTLTMGPLQLGMSPEEGARLLIHAYEKGVRFLDTADLYETYPHIRLTLKEAPDYVISTKAYVWDGETASAALERAFRGTGRDYIDLFMLHEQESIHTLRGHEEALKYLTRQKELGHIGAVGISTHHVDAVRAAATFGMIDVVHPLINMEGIGVQGGTRDEMISMIARAHDDFKLGIFAMKPLGGGHLIPRSQEAFSFILNQPWADAVAVGMQSIEEIDANVAMFENAENKGILLDALRTKKRHLMIHDYCEGCGRCVERCRQHALKIVDGKCTVDMDKCVLCGYCAGVCPLVCIKVI